MGPSVTDFLGTDEEGRRAYVHKHWLGVLWDEDHNRVLPKTAELDRRLHRMGEFRFGDSLFLACEKEFGRAIFYIPTVEWIEAFVRILRAIGAKKILEVGAGDGFTTQCLREAAPDLDFTATDSMIGALNHGIEFPPWVLPGDCVEALDCFKPDLVFWCWPPLNSDVMDGIIEHADCRLYLEIGEGLGGCTGNETTHDRYENRQIGSLSKWGRCRTDWAMIFHTSAVLFYGRGHPKFKRHDFEEAEHEGSTA